MNGKVSVCVICVKAIIYLLLNNMHDCAFRLQKTSMFGINTTALNRINGKLAFFVQFAVFNGHCFKSVPIRSFPGSYLV